ncbi:hypothetical protein Plhal304r1_c060g0146571 [Plasmopara halstedii]
MCCYPVLATLLVTIILHTSAIASPEPNLATASVQSERLRSHELGDRVKERSLKAEEGISKAIDSEERVTLEPLEDEAEKLPTILNKAGVSTRSDAPPPAKVMEAVEALKGTAGAKAKEGEKAGESIKDKETSQASKKPTTTVNVNPTEGTPATANVYIVKPTEDASATANAKPRSLLQRLLKKIKDILFKILSWFHTKDSKPAPHNSINVIQDTTTTPAAHVNDPKHEPKPATKPTIHVTDPIPGPKINVKPTWYVPPTYDPARFPSYMPPIFTKPEHVYPTAESPGMKYSDLYYGTSDAEADDVVFLIVGKFPSSDIHPRGMLHIIGSDGKRYF